jgi:hypothetical protein
MELIGEFREMATRQIKMTIDELHLPASSRSASSKASTPAATAAAASMYTHSLAALEEEEAARAEGGDADRFLSMFTLDSICYEFAADYQGGRELLLG